VGMALSRTFLGLLAILLCGCYRSSHQEADVNTMDNLDSSESTDADTSENVPDVEETDVEDASSSCDFGPLMDPVQLTFHTHPLVQSVGPDIVFTGSEFAVLWSDNRNTREEPELFFTALSPSGEKIVEDLQLSDAADPGGVGCRDAIFTGSYLGLLLGKSLADDTFPELYFTRLSTEGEWIGEESRLTFSDSSWPGWSSIAFSGSGYGIMWEKENSLMFMRIDIEGNHLGEDLLLKTDFFYGCFSIIYGAGEYVMVWDEDSDTYFPRIFFARISDDGVIVDGPRDLTWGSPCECPSIAFSGTEYGVVCERGSIEPYGRAVYFFRLSIDGERLIFDDIRLTDDTQYIHYPKIIYNESEREYGVVWLNNNDTSVYLARLAGDGTMKGDSFKLVDQLIHTNRFPIIPAGPDYAVVFEYNRVNIAFQRYGCLVPPGP
jgi:hypothetical protein